MSSAHTDGAAGHSLLADNAALRLAGILDALSDGVAIIDAAGTILVCNRGCERLFGDAAEAMIGRGIDRILKSAFDEVWDGALGHEVSAPFLLPPSGSAEAFAQHRSGDRFPVECAVTRVPAPEGPEYVVTIRDLRPRKEADERLNQLQSDLLHLSRISAIDEMGAALAHELNQPLTAIMLYLQTVQHGARAPDNRNGLREEAAAVLGKAIHEAERAATIIRRMRSFAEKREPQRKLHSLRALVDDATELTLISNHAGVRVTRNDDPEVPPVMVDGVQIQQIIVNLLRNALEAVSGRAGAEIRLSTARSGSDAIVDISDNGPGIPVDILPNLFKAFATSKTSGLGIGLAISRTIAQNHGGELLCVPGGRGQGATFILRLPAASGGYKPVPA